MSRPSHGLMGNALLGTRTLQITLLLICIALASKSVSTTIDAEQGPVPPLVGTLCILCFAILYCTTTLIVYWDGQLPLLPTAGIDGLFFVALLASSIIVGKPLSYTGCNYAAYTTTPATMQPAAATPDPQPPTWQKWNTNQASPTTMATPTPASTPTPTGVTVSATVLPGTSETVTGSDGRLYTISGRSLPLIPRAVLLGRQVLVPQQQQDTSPAAVVNNDANGWILNASEGQCQLVKAMWGLDIVLTVMFVFSASMVGFLWRAGRNCGGFKEVDDA